MTRENFRVGEKVVYNYEKEPMDLIGRIGTITDLIQIGLKQFLRVTWDGSSTYDDFGSWRFKK